MKKELKKRNQGITLIALVITIIILLILAGISIAMLTGENGVLTKAETSKVETRGASVEEKKDLWKTEKQADKYTDNKTAKSLEDLLDELVEENLLTNEEKQIVLNSEDNSIKIGNRKITFGNTLADDLKEGKIEIGDKINYKAKEEEEYISYASKNGSKDQVFKSKSDIEWKIWGIDEKTGGLMIVPSKPITTETGEQFYFSGFPGYNNGVEELDNISKIYGTGKGAVSARSLREPDVTKILKITEEDKKKACEDYGKEIVATSGTWIDGTTITEDNPKSAVDGGYWLYVDDMDILKNNTKLKELVCIDDTDESAYVLATPYMWSNKDFNFSYYMLGWGDVMAFYLVDTNNVTYDDYVGVRPIITLDPNITISDFEDN